MLPGLLAAYCFQQISFLRSIQAPQHLLDFWLPAVVGLTTLDGYVNAITGRSALFYLNLLIVKRAYRWLGSGGIDANLILFLPMALTMLFSMLSARGLHAKLRQPATISPKLWMPGLLSITALALWPRVSSMSTAAMTASSETVTMTTDWERPTLSVDKLDVGAELPDVVIAVFESLRADAMQPSVMPYASSIAATGVEFRNHYAGSNSSLLGLYGLLHGRSAANAEQDLQADNPAAMLTAFKQRGYQTAFFCGGDPAGYEEMNRLLGPARFDEYKVQAHDDWYQGDMWAISQMQSSLMASNDRPTLAIVFVMSTHFDYGAEHSGPFTPAASDWSLLVPWNAVGSGHDAVVNRYRNAVHRADALVGKELKRLQAAKTVVAITGDHGQSLYDDGTVAHWSRLSDAQTRVPLVIAGSGIQSQRFDIATMHADVAQMLLDGARGTISPPMSRPVLLVQSNPGLNYEDWAVINGSRRTAWRRQGSNLTYRGRLDHRGQLFQ